MRLFRDREVTGVTWLIQLKHFRPISACSFKEELTYFYYIENAFQNTSKNKNVSQELFNTVAAK